MKVEGRLRFDKIVEKLEERQLAGEHADRLVDHAKALYKLDPWRFLRIRDEIQDRSEEISALAEEGFEGGSEEELLRIEQLSDNIERMFKHDNVLDFLEKEREEAMRHWSIEPFPEAEDAREKIIHKLQERKSELEKQGVEQEERRKHLEELRAKLNKEFIDELHPLLEKENKGFVFIDNEERQRVMKMPAHRIGEINEARPAIVFAGLPTRPKKEQYRYHL
jgi:nitroreductase